jgi:hypothetical protein
MILLKLASQAQQAEEKRKKTKTVLARVIQQLS